MSKHSTYDFITDTLEGGFRPDTQKLWSEMKVVLDKEMPEKTDRRVVILLSIIVTAIVTICAFLIRADHGSSADPTAIAMKISKKSASKTGADQPGQSIHVPAAKNRDIQNNKNIVFDYTDNADLGVTSGQTVNGNPSGLLTSQGPVAMQPVENTSVSLAGKNQQQISRMENKPDAVHSPLSTQQQQAVKNSVQNLFDHAVQMNMVSFNQNATNNVQQTGHNGRQYVAIDQSGHLIQMPLPGMKQVMLYDGSFKGADPQIRSVDSAQAVIQPAHRSRFQLKNVVAGLSMNANIPLGNQHSSTISPSGTESRLYDFLPSVHVQYHLNRNWYLAAELQFMSPQFTPQSKLYSKTYHVYTNKFNEFSVALNKLYYVNLPVSVHYRVRKDFYLGAGLQYSHLTRSVLMEEEAVYQRNDGRWKKTSSKKTVKVKGNPNKEKARNGNNGGTGAPGQVAPFASDTIAQSLRNSDWRLLVDANYQYRRFSAGLRFNMGLTPYLKTELTGAGGVKDLDERNQSFQLYLRYNLLDRRRKK